MAHRLTVVAPALLAPSYSALAQAQLALLSLIPLRVGYLLAITPRRAAWAECHLLASTQTRVEVANAIRKCALRAGSVLSQEDAIEVGR
ncbi:MAG: hypothetical protein ACUVWR_18645 [Anaerolineae bacterium]